MIRDIDFVLEKLEWMEEENIWPNGLRYLWTDAFGVVLLVSLYHELGNDKYLTEAEEVVRKVDDVLGREKGYRIGEEEDRDGQYYHYLAMWIYALKVLGDVKEQYWEKAIQVVKDIHPHFVDPDVGVIWKMQEDLSAPYPGYGLGALDHFHGYVVYRQLAPEALKSEIDDMRNLIEKTYSTLQINQDLGLGMMLWMTHFYPTEKWASHQKQLSLNMLNDLWVDPPGYFCRQLGMQNTKFAFTNYGVSVGLQSVDEQMDRVKEVNEFFRSYQSGDEYDVNAITHVMACNAHFPGKLIVTTEE